MAMSKVYDVFTLGAEFDKLDLRIKNVEGVLYVSVYDVMAAVAPDSRATMLMSRLKVQHPTLHQALQWHKFPGQGGKGTPTADYNLLMKIIFKLPGKKATQFCESAAFSFLKVLNPTEDFIEDLRDRLQFNADGRDTANDFLIESPSKTVRAASRCYGEASMYVRMRLPEEYVNNVVNVKALTLGVLKFGITYVVHDRHATYMRDPDNGYMAMSFPMCSRKEAEPVESIFRHDLSDLTVLGSYEYVDAVRLAERLGVAYDGESYSQYVGVAQALFVAIVERVHAIWPTKYQGRYGNVYGVTEQSPRGATDHVPGEKLVVELSFPCNLISDAVARGMGFSMPDALPTPQPPPLMLTVPQDDALPDQPELRTVMTSGPLIRRDCKTGEEVSFLTITLAGRAALITGKSLEISYVDKARQLRGYHWRHAGNDYWVPTKELVYEIDDDIQTTKPRYIKRVDTATGTVLVYESYNACARRLKMSQSAKKTFTLALHKDVDFLDSKWEYVPKNDPQNICGNWYKDNSDGTVALTAPLPVDRQRTNKSGRCHGIVIGYNLITKKDLEHSSCSRAADDHGMNMYTLRDGLLDKPRQAKGIVFRSVTATEAWMPHELFRYECEVQEKDKTKYISACNESDGALAAIFEGAPSAGRILRIDFAKVTQHLNKGTVYGGYTWRDALACEWRDLFRPVSELEYNEPYSKNH